MTTTVRMHAGTVSGIPPARLRVQKNYRTLITGDASCVGIWRLDLPELLTLSGGKLVTIANWKPAGPTLTQATAAQQIPAPAVDEELATLKPVGWFDRDELQNYNLSGATFDGSAPHTTIAVCKPTDYDLTNQVAGRLGAAGEPSRLIAIRAGGASAPTFRFAYGTSSGAQIILPAADQFVYHRLIGSYDGSSKIPRLRVNDQAVVAGAASAAEAPAGSTDTWGISNSTQSFEGKIGMVGLFTADLLTDVSKATLLADLVEWMTIWVDGD